MKTFIRMYLAILSGVSVFAYHSMVPQSFPVKKTVYFFPASLKKTIPHELYHTFLDNLNMRYDVKLTNELSQHDLLSELNHTNEALLLSHSSGANQLMQTYGKLPSLVKKKAILIDPLDFQKYSFSIPSVIPGMPTIPRKFQVDLDEMDDKLKELLEKDYLEELKNSIFKQEPDDCEVTNDEILLLNHKKSSEWRLFPVIPPIDLLKMDFKNTLENTTIIQKDIDYYSHFDILDRPWANTMNRFIMNKKPKDSNIEIESYYKMIMPNIEEFYNNR